MDASELGAFGMYVYELLHPEEGRAAREAAASNPLLVAEVHRFLSGGMIDAEALVLGILPSGVTAIVAPSPEGR